MLQLLLLCLHSAPCLLACTGVSTVVNSRGPLIPHSQLPTSSLHRPHPTGGTEANHSHPEDEYRITHWSYSHTNLLVLIRPPTPPRHTHTRTCMMLRAPCTAMFQRCWEGRRKLLSPGAQ